MIRTPAVWACGSHDCFFTDAPPVIDPSLGSHVLRRTCSGSSNLLIGRDGEGLSPDCGEHSVEEPPGAETDGVVGRQPGLLLRRLNRAARSNVVEAARVEGEAGNSGRPQRKRDAL